jgi:DNA polymerase-3 subunit gamma/tau
MSVLYRKYRPQNFSEVIGQNHVKITLQHEIELGQIGHAYLFCGPRGLGKTTLARLFAKAVNCQKRKDGDSEPCNGCDSCKSIIIGNAIDIIEIDAASNTQVDKVRENIVENVRFTPTSSRYKVFIIDEVHMLSTSSFNALLKTLEEPPAHVIFILCTTEIHKIPQTIISRCQRFDLKKVSQEDLLKKMEYIIKAEKKKVDRAVLENIALHADGCLRDAESLLGKILTLGDEITMDQAEIILPKSDFGVVISFVEFILEKNSTGAIELINNLVEDGFDLQIFTDNLIELLRKLLLIKVSGSLNDFSFDLSDEQEQAAERVAQKIDYGALLSMIDLFLAKRQELKAATISQFPLEMAVVQLTEEIVCHRDDDFFDPPKSGGAAGEIKEKIKDRLAHLGGRKDKAKKEEAISKVKIDLLSRADKLKPKNFVKLEQIKDSWPQVVERLLQKNYTLSALLRISQPLKCEGNCLEIGVKSSFYKDRLHDSRNKQAIEEAISETVKARVAISGLVKNDIEPMEIGLNSPGEPEPLALESKMGEVKEAPIVSIRLQKSADVVQDVMGMF